MKEFAFTAVTESNTSKIIINNIEIISNLLNDNFKLSAYSESINQILFVWVCTEPNRAIPRPDKVSLLRKTNTIQIVFNVDYFKILNSNELDVIKIMKNAYIEGIKLLSKRKDIDTKRLLQDIKKLFQYKEVYA